MALIVAIVQKQSLADVILFYQFFFPSLKSVIVYEKY